MAAMVAASTALVSCSNDESVSAMQQDSISFNVVNGGTTRATPTTSSNYLSQVSNFQVWGYFAAGATGDGVTAGARYIGSSDTQGATINGDGSGNWSYASANEKTYWPPTTATLNFQAITPATDASFIIENYVSNKLAHVVANVTVPTSNAAQKDIMFATAPGVTKSTSSGKVNLAFKHALSQIAFKARTSQTNLTAEIGEITLCNIRSTGKVGFLSLADAAGAVNLSYSTSTSIVASYSVGLVSDKSVTSTSKDMTAASGALILLPQSTTAWTTSNNITTANTNKQTYIKVGCKIMNNGVYIVGSSSAYGTIYIPFAASWEQGKKYTYTLVIGSGSGAYDENGNAQLVPVSFTVSAADWTAVDGGNVPPVDTGSVDEGGGGNNGDGDMGQ